MEGLPALDVEWLGEKANADEMLKGLAAIADAYSDWIKQRFDEIPNICLEFPPSARANIRDAAEAAMRDCRAQCGRIEEGIHYLSVNREALEAFRLANRAMAIAMRKRRPKASPRWFPFQLAFILLSLPSTSQRAHPDRNILDLIWFPTGGGKTEAYLGLTAYVIFHRGLSASDLGAAAGTAVLTRYTLRLLTVQQFERAAVTVLACEYVRRRHDRLRNAEPYSIGLFVGQSATPNNFEQAKQLRKEDSGRGQTLLPLDSCPWCGQHLTYDCLQFEEDERVMRTECPFERCEFAGNIPIAVIDEQILANPPTFVIATIDKLAQMPWQPDLGNCLATASRHAALLT